MESLSILRKVVFESDLMATSAGRPISQAGIMSKDFKRLGFMVSFSRELGNGLIKSSTLLQAFSHHQLVQQET